MKKSIVRIAYDREQVTPGILHIGVGNFHRAHLQYYTNKLLLNSSQKQWGICGLDILVSDEKKIKSLQSQEGVYTLTVCGRDGKDQAYEIGSLVEVIWGIENQKKAIEKFADESIKIITCTITEGGYNIDKLSGDFIIEDKDIQYDLVNLDSPKTVFGYVAAGLRLRKERGNGPVTFLSCDNLQHNGNAAKRVFTSFIEEQDKELADWVANNVTFPNSMVDRITPSTTSDDVIRLNKKNGTKDKVPVYCEDFVQWVVEDNFIAGRPSWEEVGVEFTDDVAAFENMKLSLLNASHILLAYPAFLCGYRKVDKAMADQRFERLLRDFMDLDITPYVPAPKNTDLTLYKQTLIERFANKSVGDQVSRLCFDGASKFPVYIMPNIINMINDDVDMTRVAFLIASYRHYLKYKIDDKGVSYEVDDPWLTEEDEKLIESENPIDFLGLSPFRSIDLKLNAAFVNLYAKTALDLKTMGVSKVLGSIVK